MNDKRLLHYVALLQTGNDLELVCLLHGLDQAAHAAAPW